MGNYIIAPQLFKSTRKKKIQKKKKFSHFISSKKKTKTKNQKKKQKTKLKTPKLNFLNVAKAKK